MCKARPACYRAGVPDLLQGSSCIRGCQTCCMRVLPMGWCMHQGAHAEQMSKHRIDQESILVSTTPHACMFGVHGSLAYMCVMVRPHVFWCGSPAGGSMLPWRRRRRRSPSASSFCPEAPLANQNHILLLSCSSCMLPTLPWPPSSPPP